MFVFGILLLIHMAINQGMSALWFAILQLVLALIGRVVSLVVDGSNLAVLRAFVPVVIMLAICVASLVLFQSSAKNKT